MHACMYVCVYVCMYVSSALSLVHAQTYICIIHIYTFVYVCNIHTCMHAHTHNMPQGAPILHLLKAHHFDHPFFAIRLIYIHTYMHTYIHTYTHTHILTILHLLKSHHFDHRVLISALLLVHEARCIHNIYAHTHTYATGSSYWKSARLCAVVSIWSAWHTYMHTHTHMPHWAPIGRVLVSVLLSVYEGRDIYTYIHAQTHINTHTRLIFHRELPSAGCSSLRCYRYMKRIAYIYAYAYTHTHTYATWSSYWKSACLCAAVSTWRALHT